MVDEEQAMQEPKQLQTTAEVNIPYIPEKYALGSRLAGISWILAISLCAFICLKTSRMLGRAALDAKTRYDTDSLLTCQRVAAILTIILALGSAMAAGYWAPTIVSPESSAVYQAWKNSLGDTNGQ